MRWRVFGNDGLTQSSLTNKKLRKLFKLSWQVVAQRVSINADPVLNPIEWEDELASALLNDPTLPLTLEALRQPRPNFAPPLGRRHAIWAQVRERAYGDSEVPIEEAAEQDGALHATLTIKPANSAPVVTRGIFKDWYWLGTIETRLVKHPDWNHDLGSNLETLSGPRG